MVPKEDLNQSGEWSGGVGSSKDVISHLFFEGGDVSNVDPLKKFQGLAILQEIEGRADDSRPLIITEWSTLPDENIVEKGERLKTKRHVRYPWRPLLKGNGRDLRVTAPESATRLVNTCAWMQISQQRRVTGCD